MYICYLYWLFLYFGNKVAAVAIKISTGVGVVYLVVWFGGGGG